MSALASDAKPMSTMYVCGLGYIFYMRSRRGNYFLSSLRETRREGYRAPMSIHSFPFTKKTQAIEKLT